MNYSYSLILVDCLTLKNLLVLLSRRGPRVAWWCSEVRVSDSWLRDRGFNSQLLHYQVTTLGKLFTHVCLCVTVHQAYGGDALWVMLSGWEGNCRFGEKEWQPTAAYYDYRLWADLDQLRTQRLIDW